MLLKAKYLFLSFFLSSIAVFAELPDMSEFWRAYNRKDYEKADEISREVAKNLHIEYKGVLDPIEKESLVKSEEWMHLYLLRFYIQYMQKDEKSMKSVSNGIRYLAKVKYDPKED